MPIDLNRMLRQHDLLIRATALRYAKKFAIRDHGTSDDFINEARIAAWRALENYQVGHATKVETFIVRCIKNRMIDIRRYTLRKTRPSLHYTDQQLLAQVADVGPLAGRTDEVDGRLSLRAVLDDEEFTVLSHLTQGGDLGDLISTRCRMKSLGKNESRGEVVACLHRIKRKLNQNGLSLSV